MITGLLAALPTPVDFNVGEAGKDIIPYATANNTPQSYQAAFGGWLGSILSFVMLIAVILVFLYLIWGAIEWITSGGDKGKLEKARNRIIQSMIGIIVLAGTLAILLMLQQFLGICVISLGGKCGGGSSPTPTEITRCVPIATCTTNRGRAIGACNPDIPGSIMCRWRATP